MDDTDRSRAPQQPAAGRRGLLWGGWSAAIGVVLVVVGNSVGGDNGTKSELLGGGVVTGIGGILVIVGIIAVVVGLVGRSRTDR